MIINDNHWLINLFFVVTTVLFSCRQETQSTTDIVTKNLETSITTEKFKSQKGEVISIDEYIDTRFEYADDTGKYLIIENSLPKGGLKYTYPNGEEYVYAIFWARITNETANPFELSIEFPSDSFKLPSSPYNYFKIFFPSEKMTLDKVPLLNYGLTGLDAILDNKHLNLSSLKKTINSNENSLFYVVTLFKEGVEGTVRAGFSLKDDNIYYRVNDKEIYCGKKG